jgi:hypothetical protein
MKNTTLDRAAELRAELSRVESDLAAARERLGTAIADSNDAAAKSARADVASAERLASELASALPIAERRVREAAAKEAARQQAERQREANKNRARRIDAAKKVDKILVQLSKAYDELIQLETGGTEANRAHVIARQRFSVRAAFALHVPNLVRALQVQPIASGHRRSLAESESGLIQTFPEVESES